MIVAGFAPPWASRPVRLHPLMAWRVRRGRAVAQRAGIPWIVVSGGAVHPSSGTRWVEAAVMAEELRRLGWDAERIIEEPMARHTTTNLRNAGRLMRARGWNAGRVVTDPAQGAYVGWADRSGFHGRCERELGYRVGQLRALSWTEVRFVPSPDCARPGPDPEDP